MKHQIQWMALVLAFAVGVAGSLGCATMAASNAVNGSDRDFYNKPALTDEIAAIGKPDAALSSELGQEHAVAFIGTKNTYLLYKGGEELERIAQLKLDGRRMVVGQGALYGSYMPDAFRLYMKDKQVWGDLMLTYGDGKAISAEEEVELRKAEFSSVRTGNNMRYQRKISVEGVIYPAIKIPEEQVSKLGARRVINLYNPKDAKPPMLPKILKAPLIAVGVAADIVLIPVYLGLGAVVLVGAAVSH